MTTAEKNYLLLQEIEANRRFLLMAYRQNPKLLASAESRISQLLETLPPQERGVHGSKSGQRGISLIELIMFIVIVSVSLAGILTVMNLVTRSSADPLIHKQALAIAESLMEEAQLMPFTFCDPDDPLAEIAAAPGACTGGPGGPNDEDVIGPEGAGSVGGLETRGGLVPFDNVGDYHAPAFAPVVDINGVAVPAGYTASIVIGPPPVALGAVPAAETLLITVTVVGPDGVPVVLDGYRTRYAPRAGP